MDFFLVSAKFGWTWDEWQNTPAIVQRLTWIYMQMDNEVVADHAKG